MRKNPRKKLFSSSYISIRNKTYTNFVLAEMIHFILNIEKKNSLEKLFLVIECCFQTSKTDPNGKGHAKTNLILLLINSLYTHDTENQVAVCCDNYSSLIEVACEYFSIKIL